MADIQHYERVFNKKHAPKALVTVLIILYCLMVCGWFVLALISAMNLALALLVPAAILLVAIIIWKYSQVEYEYSFTAGIFSFSKIYGKSSRKTVFEEELKNLVRVVSYEKAEVPKGDKLIQAIPTIECGNPTVCCFRIDDRDVYVIIDCDELTAKIIRNFKPSSLDRSVLDGIKKTQIAGETEHA
ncbi:MAG: hypothetical protein E7677_06340 [Ruminococcaceae bacterium]|nr:hypothetical protein [Oscillospiraceae bacterium]